MEDIIQEFLEKEKLASDNAITIYRTVKGETKKQYIYIGKLLEKYNKFLRKKSYLK
jgi:hypothetical protein